LVGNRGRQLGEIRHGPGGVTASVLGDHEDPAACRQRPRLVDRVGLDRGIGEAAAPLLLPRSHVLQEDVKRCSLRPDRRIVDLRNGGQPGCQCKTRDDQRPHLESIGGSEHFTEKGVLNAMLEARNLGKFYSGIPAVKGVTFTVKPGGILGLLGPNGSGKSTTVSMITSLLEPTIGEVVLNGEPVNKAPLEYKAKIGYVPEEAFLYTYLTGPEYLELVGQLRGISPRVL